MWLALGESFSQVALVWAFGKKMVGLGRAWYGSGGQGVSLW